LNTTASSAVTTCAGVMVARMGSLSGPDDQAAYRVTSRAVEIALLTHNKPVGKAQFMQLLNTLPNIKLKFTTSDTCVQYLDVWIRKDMSGTASTVPLVFSTYQKPHNKHLYILY
jgi:hypothetical protein